MRFSPRISDLPSRRLDRLGLAKDLACYPHAGPLLRQWINIDLILGQCDELLRLGGSLKFGHATASLLLAKLQSGSPQNALARGLLEYGRKGPPGAADSTVLRRGTVVVVTDSMNVEAVAPDSANPQSVALRQLMQDLCSKPVDQLIALTLAGEITPEQLSEVLVAAVSDRTDSKPLRERTVIRPD